MKRGQLVRLHPEVSVDQLTDEAIVAACATGDRTARALLFERFVDVVHRFVTRMRGSDPDAVDDLVQATFLAAFQAAASFRGGHVRGWMFGIAANTVRNYARGEMRRKHAMRAVAERPQAPPSRDVALLARLPSAISSLHHDLRAVLILVDLEGEKGADAAAALGIPPGTLWRRLFDARRALRAALGVEP